VETVFERGWSNLQNGLLLETAETNGFTVLLTTDKNLRYQQNLMKRRIAVGVLWTTSWPELLPHASAVAETHQQSRVIDESGADYLFPASYFARLDVSPKLRRLLLRIV
jgi:hypothetical protein